MHRLDLSSIDGAWFFEVSLNLRLSDLELSSRSMPVTRCSIVDVYCVLAER